MPVNGDRAGELNETFVVNVGLVAGNAVLGDAQGVGTIVDDEPRVNIDSVTKSEGNSGTTQFVFTVSLSTASSAAVSLNFATANGSAKSGEDYDATSGSLAFAPGQTSKTIAVAVKGDRKFEWQEVFYVNLSGAVGRAHSSELGREHPGHRRHSQRRSVASRQRPIIRVQPQGWSAEHGWPPRSLNTLAFGCRNPFLTA